MKKKKKGQIHIEEGKLEKKQRKHEMTVAKEGLTLQS